ncbi:MAG: transcriptional regulator [Bacteroidota bacterium]
MSKRKNTPVSGHQGMTSREIRAHLILNGVKCVDLARQLGVHQTAVTLIITRRENSRRIQEAVAKAINKPFEEVWGKRIA